MPGIGNSVIPRPVRGR